MKTKGMNDLLKGTRMKQEDAKMVKDLLQQFSELNTDAQSKLIDFLKAVNGVSQAAPTPEQREADKAYRQTMQQWDKIARGEIRQ